MNVTVISTDKNLLQIIIPEIKNDNNASINSCRVESDTSVDLGTNGRQPSPQALQTEPEASQSAVSQCPMCGKSFGPRYIYIVVYCHFLVKNLYNKTKNWYKEK